MKVIGTQKLLTVSISVFSHYVNRFALVVIDPILDLSVYLNCG